jgi:FMN phosphatase YigB (HAD superfamily)
VKDFASRLNRVYISDAVNAEGKIPELLHNIRGIILDFDGTLFDNALIPFWLIAAYTPDILRIWRERLVRKRFTGRDFSTPEKYYRAFFAAMGTVCRKPSDVMRNWYFNHYMPRMIRVLKKHYVPRPGVKEFLSRLESPAGSPWGLPANFPKIAVYSDYPFLRERFASLGIAAGPKLLLYGPESFGAQKPAPRPFLRIAEDLGARPDEVLVIGDREETDGLGAFNAGMRFFCLKTGRQRYFRFDPYRRHPSTGEQQPGPSLLMYAGAWTELIELFTRYYRR